MDERNSEFPQISSVSSATECTGLIPAAPVDDEEYEAYQELYCMAIPKIKPEQDKEPQ